MNFKLKILYEDNHIIAVYKPAGLLVQPASPVGKGDKIRDRSLMDEVKKYLKGKYKKPGNVFLGLVHRLDRNVSGIVLFGKTSKGASRLSEQFRNNEIKKIYHAVVEGVIKPSSGTLVHYLKKDENKKIALVSSLPKKDFLKSELSYRTMLPAYRTGRHSTYPDFTPRSNRGRKIEDPRLLDNRDYTLLSVFLKTGRFHQIRAQFSAIGHPVAGDKKYRPAGRQVAHLKDGSLALCATEIEFKTATTSETININIDYPAEWDDFFKNPPLSLSPTDFPHLA